jgi:SEL1 protein
VKATQIQLQSKVELVDIWYEDALETLQKDQESESYLGEFYSFKQEFITKEDHPKMKAFAKLKENADLNHLKSVQEVADILLFGKYDIKPDPLLAFSYYEKLSNLDKDNNGNALYRIGEMYATGIGVERNYQKALIYVTFAAAKGNLMAHQTLGYWYNVGIGVVENCEKGLFHFQKVADALYKEFNSGPPGGKRLPTGHKKLDSGGIYGGGASGSVSCR